jgi:hypothetical protein
MFVALAYGLLVLSLTASLGIMRALLGGMSVSRGNRRDPRVWHSR